MLNTDFKTDMEAYRRSRAENHCRILTLQDLVNAIKSEPCEEYPNRNVIIMLQALETRKNSPDYLFMLQKQEYYASLGSFGGAMDRHRCDVIIASAGSLSLYAFAGMGRNPVMSVPMGFYLEETEVRIDESRGDLVSVALGIPYLPFFSLSPP